MCIYDIIESIKNNQSLEYGIENGFVDRRIGLALGNSWDNINIPVNLYLRRKNNV